MKSTQDIAVFTNIYELADSYLSNAHNNAEANDPEADPMTYREFLRDMHRDYQKNNYNLELSDTTWWATDVIIVNHPEPLETVDDIKAALEAAIIDIISSDKPWHGGNWNMEG